MACLKILSGSLPELLDEIMQYFRNDFSTLHSCILVNRLWCRTAIPLLWEDPFSNPKGNYQFIETYLDYLNEEDKRKLIDYGIYNNLSPSPPPPLLNQKTLFNYPSFIKSLNTWKIFHFIVKWVMTVRPLTIEERPVRAFIQDNNTSSYPEFDHNLNPAQIKNVSRLIYDSLFKIGSEVNLNSFEVTTSGIDHDYFDDAFELILRNPKLISNIKNLKLSFNGKITTLIYDFLKCLHENCNSISTLYFHFKMNYDDVEIKNHSSKIITSQQNLEKILFGYYLSDKIFYSLKNPNCSNTLKTIIFYNVNFRDINGLKQVFQHLNVLESIHLLYCSWDSNFVRQIIKIKKPFKLRSLFMREKFKVDQFQLLLQRSEDYLENVGLLMNNKLKQRVTELIIKYCKKIKFFDLSGFDDQNIHSSLDLIKKFQRNLNYLSINFDNLYTLYQSRDEIIKLSSTLLRQLGQNLPIKLEYLELSLAINSNDFEIFLKNFQNTTFIKNLLIKNKIQVGSSKDILPLIKEYIMKMKKVRYLAFIMEEDFTKKSKDLFSLKNEVKEFELYNVIIQNYDNLKIQHYNFIEEMY